MNCGDPQSGPLPSGHSFGYSDRQAFDHCRTLDVDRARNSSSGWLPSRRRCPSWKDRSKILAPEADSAAIEALEAQQPEAGRKAIEQTLHQVDPRDLPLAGAVVYVDQRGKLALLRGLVRVENRKAQTTQEATSSGSASTAAATAAA